MKLKKGRININNIILLNMLFSIRVDYTPYHVSLSFQSLNNKQMVDNKAILKLSNKLKLSYLCRLPYDFQLFRARSNFFEFEFFQKFAVLIH